MMRFVKSQLVRLWRDEQGATAPEYILIFVAIGVPLALTLYFYGDKLKEKLVGLYEEVFTQTDELKSDPF